MITESLPTPLGPLITMINGLGGGFKGSEPKGEPNAASSPPNSSAWDVHMSFDLQKTV